MRIEKVVGFVCIVFVFYISYAGLQRTPTFAFWKSGKAFTMGLVYTAENILLNVEQFHDRSVANLGAYRETRAWQGRAEEGTRPLVIMTATEVFSRSCVDRAVAQLEEYRWLSMQAFQFDALLVPFPARVSSSSLEGERQ